MNAHPPLQAARSGLQRSTTFVLLLLVFLLPLALLLYPPARDQSAFLLCGRVIREGGMPYRDCWDLKGPAVYLLAAWAQGVVGPSLYPLRAVDVVATWASALLLMLLLPLPRRQRLLAGSLWEMLYLNLNYWNNTQAESFALPLLLAGTWLATRPKKATPQTAVFWFLAGLLWALAFLFKPTALIVALAVALTLLTSRPIRQTWLPLLLGGSVPILIAGLWLWAGRTMGPFLDILRFAQGPYLHATGAANLRYRLISLVFANRWLLRNDHLLPTLLALIAFPVAWRSRRGRALVAFLVGSWLSVHVQGHYWAYHWIWLLAPLAGLALWGWHELHHQQTGRWVSGVLLAGLVGVPLLFYPQELPRILRLTLTRAPTAPRLAVFGNYGRGHFSLLADREVAQYIKAHTRSDERVLVWGFEPGIYLMADRLPATRFIYDLPLTLEDPGHRWRGAWRQEFMNALEQHPPALVVVATQDITAVEKQDSWTQMQQFPEFARWVQEHYREKTRIERFVIYRRAG